MFSIIFLCALCFGTTVEALQTITHNDHLDVMHQPIYICVLAGVDFLLWCLVFRYIGGYTFHQRTAIESSWLKTHPHYPCPNSQQLADASEAMNVPEVQHKGSKKRMKSSKEHSNSIISGRIGQDKTSFFDDPRHDLLNLSRDLVPCFILIVTCLAVYSIDQSHHPNAPKYIDPIMALLTIAFLIVSSLSMAKKASLILLQSLPEEMEDVEILCKDLKVTFPKCINDVHEVHVWALVPSEIYATLHILFKDEESYLSSLSAIPSFLSKYGINHTTIQPEFSSCNMIESTRPQGSCLPCTHSKDTSTEYDDDAMDIQKELKPKGSIKDAFMENVCQYQCSSEDCIRKRCCLPKNNIDLVIL